MVKSMSFLLGGHKLKSRGIGYVYLSKHYPSNPWVERVHCPTNKGSHTQIININININDFTICTSIVGKWNGVGVINDKD
jgi:hypothetical protein